MKLWIVGKWRSGEAAHSVWDFQGVFSSEKRAVAACRSWRYFVGPATLDRMLPELAVEWEDGFYPIERKLGDE